MKRLLVCLTALIFGAATLVAGGGSAQAAPSHARPAHTAWATGYTSVVVAPAVYQLIASAGITPAPVDGAKAAPFRGTLEARFPITGYTVTNLRIKHSGGLTLTAGSATIGLRNFWIDLARLRVSGEVAGSIGSVGRVDLFTIGLSGRPDLGLVSLRLTATAAGALNATFGVNAFSAGALFGYATPRPFGRF